jgi:hypothetical protein
MITREIAALLVMVVTAINGATLAILDYHVGARLLMVTSSVGTLALTLTVTVAS